MIPLRTHTASAPSGSASPSVTLEKGSYRVRIQPRFTPLDSQPASMHRPQRQAGATVSARMMILIILLALACLSSFGMAYYLFTSRWDDSLVNMTFKHADLRNQVDIAELVNTLASTYNNANSGFPSGSGSPERFLAYLPHSGFNNQRIALENALVLARILNRTLLMPPARLGRPIPYRTFHVLHDQWALSDKAHLRHCAQLPRYDPSNPECFNYRDYINVPWSSLVNLTALTQHQRVIDRPKMTTSWIQETFVILPEHTLTYPDKYLYEYRFLDDPSDALTPQDKYFCPIYIHELALSTQPLIHFGTLFGTSRLRLRHPQHIAMRTEIRRNMAFSNPLIHKTANSIVEAIGGKYLAIHLRLTDGVFQIDQGAYLRSIWWETLHHVLQYSYNDVVWLETSLHPFGSQAKPPVLDIPEHRRSRHYVVSPLIARGRPPFGCRRKLHSNPRFGILNAPVFIATDVDNPRNNPILSGFRVTFPCAMFLDDFKHYTAPLRKNINREDGLGLGDFYMPFIDAVVAARAEAVVGTPGSTFSTFIEEVLWPKYHKSGN